MRNFNFKKTKFIFGLSAVIILLGLSACNNAQQCNSATLHHSIVSAINAPVQWEYKVVFQQIVVWSWNETSQAATQKFNELGAEGWELVSSGGIGNRDRTLDGHIFKRRLSPAVDVEIEW